MNGPELLEHAAGLVNRRRREYGEPVDLFEQVAQRWSLTLGAKVSPAQVVLCLIDLKLARLARDPKHLDSQVDVAGYAAVLREVTIDQAMHDAAKDFQAAFIIAQLDPLRALPVLRVPATGREPDLSERQLHARRRVHEAMAVLGGISSPAGSCVWHVVGLQRSVREWAIRQGWGGRPVEQTEARGILVAGLGVLAAHSGYAAAKRAS